MGLKTNYSIARIRASIEIVAKLYATQEGVSSCCKVTPLAARRFLMPNVMNGVLE